MKVMGVKCSACQEIIYSRAHHDYHFCSCGKTSVDGGRDYLRYGWDPSTPPPERVDIEVDATEKELYDDWNKSKDKFGRVKTPKSGRPARSGKKSST